MGNWLLLEYMYTYFTKCISRSNKNAYQHCVTRYLKLRRWFFLFLPFWMRWGLNLAEIQFFRGGGGGGGG